MPNLDALLTARSIAIVGASNREGSFGWHVVRQLLDFGYTGDIIPINPTSSEIQGITAFASCSAVGRPIDCAAICVGDDRLEAALTDVIAAGIPAAIIFGTAVGTASTGEPLADWITAQARDAGLALQGPNCMGHYSFANRQFLTGYPYHREPGAGAIGFITHSGSLFSAIVKNNRGLNFNFAISPGQERVLTAADYLAWMLEQPSTRVVALVLETIRDPGRFQAALAEANRRAIPVVLLKIGRSEHGAAMAMSHTGAIAGDQAVIEAVAARYNVVLVRTIEELLDTLELFASGRRWGDGDLAAVADSGGERTLMVDLAADRNLPWAALTAATVQVLASTLDEGLAAVNPVDLWGTGHDWQRIYRTCLGALLADETVGALSFGIDFNNGSRLNPDYAAIATETFQATTRPFAVVSNVAAGIDPDWAARLRSAGVPVLQGTETGLAAFAHLRTWSGRVAQTSAWQSVPELDQEEIEPLDFLDRPLDEWLSVYYLQAEGLLTSPYARQASNKTELIKKANSVGYPVALKSLKPGLVHKSEAGGVALNIPDYRALHQEYEYMSRALGPQVMVCEMVDTSRGTELILGSRNDPQFGPLVTLGMGGIWVEIMRDLITFLAPVSPDEVLVRLPELRSYPRLLGARGVEPVDLPKLARVVAHFSQIAHARRDEVATMEINPLLAVGDKFTMLDALIIPAGAVLPSPE